MRPWTAAVWRMFARIAICSCAFSAQAKPPVLSGPASVPPILVIPQPAHVRPGEGEYVFTADTRIVASSTELRPLAGQLRGFVQPAMGFPLPVVRAARAGDLILALDPDLERLGPEGYRLEITRTGVRLGAFAPAGIFYAIQTLRQLLPADAMRPGRAEGVRWSVPAVVIEDRPRFRWRGAHLDVVRHFMTKDVVLKFLDLLAMHKFNVFHWHLVGDQGWRIEIRKYPRLALAGGKTDFTSLRPAQPDRTVNIAGGGHYTQAEIREVLRHAAARHITVVPEIEMPGHSAAAIAAYPGLGNKIQIAASGGDTSFMKGRDAGYNVDESTLRFLEDVLTEVMALFPGEFIHIGGDEFDPRPWRANPAVQSRIRNLGLKDESALQAWFIRRMERFVAAHGRRAVGWDEILSPGLPRRAVVMSWRGVQGGIAAARSGHDVVMAPADFTYLDSYQWIAPRTEPLAKGGFLPLEKVYAFEPVPAELSNVQARHVLGAQAQLWTEFITNAPALEYAAWPRLSAFAEVLWSPRGSRNYAEFITRLKPDLEKLRMLEVRFRPLTPIPAPAARWQAGDTATQQEWEVRPAASAGHQIDVVFAKTGGRGQMELEWVELRENDTAVMRVTRPGSTDWKRRANDYLFDLRAGNPRSRYAVRASTRGTGGTDATGDLYLVPGEGPTPR